MIETLLFMLYPETHFRFKLYPFSKYFRKEPEILIDVPHRILNGDNIPLYLIIHDADKYNVHISKIDVVIADCEGMIFKEIIHINRDFTSHYEDLTLNLKAKPITGYCELEVKIYCKIGSNEHVFINDNFRFKNSLLKFFYGSEKCPFNGYFEGDVHSHSNYTDDQVEFGSSIPVMKSVAQKSGLDFFMVSDHSYDLDDRYDNYLKQDDKLNKFHDMRTECNTLTDDTCTIIPSEEVTARNSKNRNIHFIACNSDKFFYGTGDSAESWFQTYSENSISDIIENSPENTFHIAAHPFVPVPKLEYFLLKRGAWSCKDIVSNGIKAIQILNGEYDISFYNGIKQWRDMLLTGHKVFICAGNDAHGNFSSFRQVKFPFFKLTKEDKQLFGRARTVIKSDSKSISSIKKAIENGNSYITTGIYLEFFISNSVDNYTFGETIESFSEGTISFNIKSNEYSGNITKINIICGNMEDEKEFRYQSLYLSDNTLEYEKEYIITDFGFECYFRLEVETENSKAYTNPIFIKPSNPEKFYIKTPSK